MSMFHRRLSIGQAIAATAVFLTLAIFATLGISAVARPHSAGASAESLIYTPLTLKNGWVNGPFATRNTAVAKDSGGIVHFKGAMSTPGTNPTAFTLPAAFRPSGTVYVAVDMCDATNGRIQIDTNGDAIVEPEGSVFSNAACFTSLEGVSFAK